VALHFYAQACALEDRDGCYEAGIVAGTLLGPNGAPSTDIKYFRLACRLRSARGCNRLSELVDAADADTVVIELQRRACSLGSAEGCWNAQQSYAAMGREREAAAVYARACRLARAYCKREKS